MKNYGDAVKRKKIRLLTLSLLLITTLISSVVLLADGCSNVKASYVMHTTALTGIENLFNRLEVDYRVINEEKDWLEYLASQPENLYVVINYPIGKLTAIQKEQMDHCLQDGTTFYVLPASKNFLACNYPDLYQFNEPIQLDHTGPLKLTLSTCDLDAYLSSANEKLLIDNAAMTLKSQSKLHILYTQNDEIGAAYSEMGGGRIYYCTASPNANELFWEYMTLGAACTTSCRYDVLGGLKPLGYTTAEESFYKLDRGKTMECSFNLNEDNAYIGIPFMCDGTHLELLGPQGKTELVSVYNDCVWQVKGKKGPYRLQIGFAGEEPYTYIAVYLTHPREKIVFSPFKSPNETYTTNKSQLTITADSDQIIAATCSMNRSGMKDGAFTKEKEHFQYTLLLDPSISAVELSYIDEKGIRFTEHYFICYAATPPKAAFEKDFEDAYDTEVVVLGVYTERDCDFFVNGQKCKCYEYPPGFCIDKEIEWPDGLAHYSMPILYLNAGKNQIHMEICDRAGNKTEKDFILYRYEDVKEERAPYVTYYNLYDGCEINEDREVRVYISDESTYQLEGVWLGEQLLSCEEESVTIRVKDFKPGDYPLKTIVTDHWGNTTVKVINVKINRG